jgi:hypothetical protein
MREENGAGLLRQIRERVAQLRHSPRIAGHQGLPLHPYPSSDPHAFRGLLDLGLVLIDTQHGSTFQPGSCNWDRRMRGPVELGCGGVEASEQGLMTTTAGPKPAPSHERCLKILKQSQNFSVPHGNQFLSGFLRSPASSLLPHVRPLRAVPFRAIICFRAMGNVVIAKSFENIDAAGIDRSARRSRHGRFGSLLKQPVKPDDERLCFRRVFV